MRCIFFGDQTHRWITAHKKSSAIMKQNISQKDEANLTCATLGTWIRGHVPQFIQHVFEEEVTAPLGRQQSDRRTGVEGANELSEWLWQAGPAQVKPRHDHGATPPVRECNERLVSRMLPFLKRKSTSIDHLLSKLYLPGLAQGDFDLAVRGLLGEIRHSSPQPSLG